MAMTLLGISGSLTSGGSTRTAIDCALRAAQQRYPEVTTAVLDLRDVALAFCSDKIGATIPDGPCIHAIVQFSRCTHGARYLATGLQDLANTAEAQCGSDTLPG